MPVNIGDKLWKCSKCGNELTVDNPPRVCPMCKGLNSYYEIPEVQETSSEEITSEEGVL